MLNKHIVNILKNSSIGFFNHKKEKYPSVFYTGLGKSASRSICEGFINNKVAHWHSEKNFEDNYKINIGSLTLLDIINAVSKHKKVLIIESVRDPISRVLSIIFQEFYLSRIDPKLSTDIKFIKKWIINYILYNNMRIYSTKWNQYYNINIYESFDPNQGYFYQNLQNNIQLLFLRYEDILNYKNIITNIGYVFENKYTNATSSRENFKNSYDIAKKTIKFSVGFLEKLYNTPGTKSFYTDEQIANFIKKHRE